VYRQTAERAASIGLELVTLPAWYDVDDATSLGWLCRELLGGRRPQQFTREGYPASHTRDYLLRLIALGDVRPGMIHALESISP
jgi:hypothetical protein